MVFFVSFSSRQLCYGLDMILACVIVAATSMQRQKSETGGNGSIMNIIETLSILTGSIILLGLFLPIAYEGVRAKSTSKQSRISVLNDKWKKLTVSAR